MYRGIAGPGKDEQADGHEWRSNNRRGKPELGFAATDFARGLFLCPKQAQVILVEEGVQEPCNEHAGKETEKGEASLREGEAVGIAKDNGKGAKEEVEDAEEESREETEIGAHGFE